MNKTSSRSIVLGVAAVWLGGHFGPGFATGAFSTTYYVQHGAIGLLTPFIAMLVTGGVMYFMVEYSRSHGTQNYRPFAISCFGEKGGQVMSALYDITFLLMVMCAGGLALSGEGNILQAQLHIPYAVGIVGTILISALLCLYGSKLLAMSSKYMMYAIIAVVSLITVISLAKGGHDIPGAFANSAANAPNPGVLSAVLDGLLYGCFQSTVVFNVISVSDLLSSRKESQKAILSGYIITVFLMICMAFTLFTYTNIEGNAILNESVPLMWVLKKLGFGWLTGIYVLLMTLAVLSTTAGLASAGCARFDKLFQFIGNRQLRRVVITAILLGLAALGASFGMSALMRKGTSLVGYIGIPVLVIPAFTWVRAKINQDQKA